ALRSAATRMARRSKPRSAPFKPDLRMGPARRHDARSRKPRGAKRTLSLDPLRRRQRGALRSREGPQGVDEHRVAPGVERDHREARALPAHEGSPRDEAPGAGGTRGGMSSPSTPYTWAKG